MSLSDWAGIPKPESLTTTAGPNTADSISPDTVLTALSRVKLNGAYCTDDGSSDVVECVRGAVWAMWSRDVSTLFMERRDLELVGVVRRTVGNAQRAVSQVNNNPPSMAIIIHNILHDFTVGSISSHADS